MIFAERIKMTKKHYEKPEITVSSIKAEDVITTSFTLPPHEFSVH